MTEKDIVICGHGSNTPSFKNLQTYNTLRHNTIADNGVCKDIVCVRRLKGFTDENRATFKKYYTTIIGRNFYNQNLREYCYVLYKGKFYSDCSSSGIKTFEKCGYKFPWTLNTAAIYNSDMFETVPVKIKDGHIQNPEVLKVGDAILYKGNDPKRPLQIGHVEYVYSMPTVLTLTPKVEEKKSIKYPCWIKVGSGPDTKWYYRLKEGVNVHGWRTINHHKYWFDETGLMAKEWKEIDGKWYYFQPESGKGASLAGALYVSDEDGAQSILYI